jgi:general secretion pathway protein A
MLLEHYGFAEPPFSITPDPRFVYLGERHRDALAHLHYGVTQGGGGGFVQLTGEVGTGKTTLCRLLLEQLPDTVRVALVLNPLLSPVELLEAIAEELRLEIGAVRGSLKGLYDTLNHFLLDAYAQGLRVVVIIDEAQNLSRDALEQVRLLTNLETPTQKLLQMVLLGQPELRDLLERPELRQLAQRITARFHLTPLDADEVEAYVRHRVAVAGATRFPFTRLALKRLYHHSGGVPRLVNVIAERALLAGYARDEHPVGERLVNAAAREVLVRPLSRLPKPSVPVVAALLLVLAIGLFALAPSRSLAPPTPQLIVDMTAPLPPPRLDAPMLATRLSQLDEQGEAAAGELMRLWAVRANEATPAELAECPPFLAPGLLCQGGELGLENLVAMQRPALVFLQAAPSGSGSATGTWAVLLGADALRVRLWLGEITVDVERIDFLRHFKGRARSLLRVPQVLYRLPNLGDSGSDVDWLAVRLAEKARQPNPIGPAEFDAAMISGLRETQRVHDLQTDGTPGPATLRALGAERRDGPRLRRSLD